MIGANKILTVSYGTFSCTLEGFDEPFTTMKAIAEYFRDLAAEDRYFGAEPPTPDAEMLHRIAEREIQRRVEAKISENAVVLRQVETPAPADVTPAATPTVAAGVAATPAPVTLPAAAPAEVAAEAAPVVTEAPAVTEAVAATPAEDDSISDKLRRIRAVVAHAQTQPAVAAGADTAFYEDLAGADADLSTETAEYAEPMDDDFGFTLELDPQDLSDVLSLNEPDEAPQAEVVELMAAIEVEAKEAPEAAHDAAGIAPGPEAAAAAEPVLAEVETVIAAEAEEPALDALREVLAAEAVADTAAGTDVDPGVTEAQVWEAIEQAGAKHVLKPEAAKTAPRSEAEIWDAVEAIATHGTPAAQPAAAEAEQIEAEETAAEDAGVDQVATEEAGADAVEAEDAEAGDLSAEILRAEDLATEEMAAEEMAVEDLDDEDAPMSPLASLIARTRARVESARTGAVPPADLDDVDLDDLAANLEADEIAAEGAGHEDAVALVGEAAEAESDNDLIAGIEAAIGAIDEREAAEQAAEAAAEPERTTAAGKSMLVEDAEDGDDFERLMEEANTKLEGAESRRRFSAISHLKAAVAATVADRLLKPKDAPVEAVAPVEPEIDRYRDDLSRAVRPRRPETEGERVTARPAMAMRPAPLVLVSEQRVDRENLQPAAAVRPRRVATTLIVGDEDDLNDAEPLSPEDAKSFTDFAERLGARSLAELLEVAAVYTATVEGKDSFSRPHLLRRVNAATGVEDFSREDYLRSFGSLLRQGRIQKVEPGRFSVTDVSPFMTEMRRAAN